MPRRAFSYRRVSQKKLRGTSIQRQEDFAAALCRENGWNLDDTLIFTDHGRSAFRGRNRTATADLTRLLACIQDDRIPKGSVIIVENIDRLSRQDVKVAYRLFLEILGAGCWIATQEPRSIYRPDDEDLMSLFEPLWQMYLANAESKKKSFRAASKWEESRKVARESGRVMLQHLPSWCVRVGDQVVADEKACYALKRLCEHLASGLGAGRTAQEMEREGIPTLTGRGRWTDGSIKALVKGDRLLGTYQPSRMVDGKRIPEGAPLVAFYPAAVSAELLGAAQRAVQSRRRRGGRTAVVRATNVFRGLAFSKESGRPLALASNQRGEWFQQYLWEANQAGGFRVHYADVVRSVLLTVSQLTASDVTPLDATRDARESRMVELSATITALAQRQRVLTGRLSDPTQDESVILEALASVKVALASAAAERDGLSNDLLSGAAEALGHAQSLAKLRAGTKGEDLIALDAQIAAALPLVIARIDVERERHHYRSQTVRLTIHLRCGGVRLVRIEP